MIVHPLTDADLVNRGELIARADVELLVRSFYRYAAMDELLGPIFRAAPPHPQQRFPVYGQASAATVEV